MSQGSLGTNVRNWEMEKFPEFRESKLYAPPKSSYFYFGPSWHLTAGLLDRFTLDAMKRKDSNILSVGSGKAFLERFMVSGWGIDRKRITLCDIEPVMPKGFSSFLFDMYKDWPSFGKRFGYVIFPESVMPFARHPPHRTHDRPLVAELEHLIRNAVAVLEPEGEIRMSLCNCEYLVDMLRNEGVDLGSQKRRLTFRNELLIVDTAQ